MADGLTFLLELDAKLEGALGLVRVLKDTDVGLKKVDAGLRKVEQASGNASAGHAKHGAAAQHTGGILDRFLHATLHPLHSRLLSIAEFEFARKGVDALIEAPMEALHLFTELLEKMIEVSAEAERTELSFKLMFGESEGKETLEWIESISKFTEFTGRELKGAAQDLAKVGFEGEELTRALAASLDIAAFDKSGEAGLAGAIGALERIKRTGKVEGRTLGGLGIKTEDFFGEMAKQTGKSRKVLQKEMTEGKLDADKSIETLYTLIGRRTGKDLGGAGVAMSETLGARLKHLKELPDLFFEKLKGTKGFAAISDFVGHLLDVFSPDGDLGMGIQESLDKLFDTAGEKLAGIDIEGIIRNVPAAITAITATVETLASVIRPVVSAFEAIAKFTGGDTSLEGKNAAAWRNDPEGMALGIKLRGKLASSRAAAARGEPYQDPDKPFGPQEPGIDRLRKQHDEMNKPMAAVGEVGGKSFSDSFTKSMVSAGQSGGLAAVDGTKEALQQHSPSRVFENIGLMAGEGFNQGLDKSMSVGDDVARGAFAMPAPTGGARGGTSIQVEINTTVNASGNGEHIAQDVSQQIREILPGALQSAIEQLAGQAGSA